jgi:NAD-dependent DNA ligase
MSHLPGKGSTALKVVANGPFKDKVVVFTGTLESLTRDKATYHVEKAGGRVAGNSDFVVVSAGCCQKLEQVPVKGPQRR